MAMSLGSSTHHCTQCTCLDHQKCLKAQPPLHVMATWNSEGWKWRHPLSQGSIRYSRQWGVHFQHNTEPSRCFNISKSGVVLGCSKYSLLLAKCRTLQHADYYQIYPTIMETAEPHKSKRNSHPLQRCIASCISIIACTCVHATCIFRNALWNCPIVHPHCTCCYCISPLTAMSMERLLPHFKLDY